MTTFKDGPAAGVSLMLKRAPIFLRAVFDGKSWDALDQLEDTPNPNEAIFVYVLKERPGMCHIRAAKGAGGFYPIAIYIHHTEQPGDDITSNSSKWAKWCNQPAHQKYLELLSK